MTRPAHGNHGHIPTINVSDALEPTREQMKRASSRAWDALAEHDPEGVRIAIAAMFQPMAPVRYGKGGKRIRERTSGG